MITEEQLLDLGFKQVDPVWEENANFHFYLLDMHEDLFLMTNCSDEDNAFIVDRLNEVNVSISDEKTLRELIELLGRIIR